MSAYRITISLFLFVVYSISFTHDLIPHCHLSKLSDAIAAGSREQRLHFSFHSHAKFQDLDEDDIRHENHLDDSLFDYVVCLLSELDHYESDQMRQHYIPADPTELSKKEIAKVQLVASIIFTLIDPVINEPSPQISRDIIFNFQNPFLVSAQHRGPPSVA